MDKDDLNRLLATTDPASMTFAGVPLAEIDDVDTLRRMVVLLARQYDNLLRDRASRLPVRPRR